MNLPRSGRGRAQRAAKCWIVVACGASLVVAVPTRAQAADPATGLRVQAERPSGFDAKLFPSSIPAGRSPFVVTPREAWESGAHAWSATRRARFAADKSVRVAAVGLKASVVASRGDRDPAGWLPPTGLRCVYVAKWISVKSTWGLSADRAELARLRQLVTACAGSSPTTSAASSATAPGSSTASSSVPITSPKDSPASGAGSPSSLAGGLAALRELEKVRVSPEYTTGYNRDFFPHWKDLDRDGCDTRSEVLIRDSKSPVVVGPSCRVSNGTWYSAYDGITWTNPSDVDIDHVVALSEAWRSGAYAWSTQQRLDFANDLGDTWSLLAVTDSVNQSKSDKDPARWLPPLASFRCTYLNYWVAIKVRWELSMDLAEYRAVQSGLVTCAAS